MKITIIGNAKKEYFIEIFFTKAFKNLGCSAEFLDMADFYAVNLADRILNHFRPLNSYRMMPEKAESKLEEEIIKTVPDLVLFCKPIFISPQLLLRLEKKGILKFSWFPDDFLCPRSGSVLFGKSIPYYDCHFTTKSYNVAELLQRGARKAVFLPHAANLEELHEVKVDECEQKQIGADIVFIGTYEKERAQILERLCRLGYNIKIYGWNWHKALTCFSLRRANAMTYKVASFKEMARIISSSKIILGFLRKISRDLQTVRTYEIPACAGFMMHERTAEAMQLFQEGKEAEFFGDFKELKTKIDFYLKNETLRKQIARSGHERLVNSGYTFEARAREILKEYHDIKS